MRAANRVRPRSRRGRCAGNRQKSVRGATAVGPYSPRALPDASVSTPLDWDELSEGIRPDHFKIDNLRQRLDVLEQDPWREIGKVRQKLPAG